MRLWEVSAGRSRAALLLGPLAVHPDYRRHGIGSALMRRALHEAGRRGHRAVLLVGDASYYGRFGFSAEPTGGCGCRVSPSRIGCSAANSRPARLTAPGA